MTNLLLECTHIIRDLAGHDILYFDHAVEVKLNPHSLPFRAWAVCVSPADKLFVMDENEQWNELEAEDVNAVYMIGSLYQRLRLMRINYAKAS